MLNDVFKKASMLVQTSLIFITYTWPTEVSVFNQFIFDRLSIDMIHKYDLGILFILHLTMIWSARGRTHQVWGINWEGLSPNAPVIFPSPSASLMGKHMEEDEKHSNLIGINVGGNWGSKRNTEKYENRTEKADITLTSWFFFASLPLFNKKKTERGQTKVEN